MDNWVMLSLRTCEGVPKESLGQGLLSHSLGLLLVQSLNTPQGVLDLLAVSP
jgi:hypothetical protein